MKTGNFDLNAAFNKIVLLCLMGLVILLKAREYQAQVDQITYELVVEKRIAVMRDSLDFWQDGYYRSAAANETTNRMWIEELNKNQECKDWYHEQKWKKFDEAAKKKAKKKNSGLGSYFDTSDYRPFYFDTSHTFEFKLSPWYDTTHLNIKQDTLEVGTWTIKRR